MRNRALRPIAALVCIIVLTGVPAQAGPIVVHQVIQVMSSYQTPPDLRLRGVSQNSAVIASGVHAAVRPEPTTQRTGIASQDISSGAPSVPIHCFQALRLRRIHKTASKSSTWETLKEPFATAVRLQLLVEVFRNGRCCFSPRYRSSSFMVVTIARNRHQPRHQRQPRLRREFRSQRRYSCLEPDWQRLELVCDGVTRRRKSQH